MNNGFYYEREKVRKIVLAELLDMLLEANKENINFDLDEARMKISVHLKQAYYESSYNSINNWAAELGII